MRQKKWTCSSLDVTKMSMVIVGHHDFGGSSRKHPKHIDAMIQYGGQIATMKVLQSRFMIRQYFAWVQTF